MSCFSHKHQKKRFVLWHNTATVLNMLALTVFMLLRLAAVVEERNQRIEMRHYCQKTSHTEFERFMCWKLQTEHAAGRLTY